MQHWLGKLGWPHLVEDVVRLVEVKDEVELADVPEVAVENLNVVLNDLERDELVIGWVRANAEVQARVPAPEG